MDTQKIYHDMGISSAVLDYCRSAEEELKPRFSEIDAIAEYNQAKVVAAMQKNRVSAECFAASTGYGYNDLGRDVLARVVNGGKTVVQAVAEGKAAAANILKYMGGAK